ncbi:MAG: META domain-containing protein [Flavobacterium sp.]|jgi:heat shock protein HslJ
MKKIYYLIVLTLFINCKNKEESKIEIQEKCPDLKEITVDVSNFDTSETTFTNWLLVYSTTSNGNGSMNKVKIFTSPEEIIKDTKQNASKILYAEGGEYLGKVMAKRFKNVVDFSKYNLIIAYFTAGNSNSTINTVCQSNNIEFCINSNGVEPVAKYYIIEKNNYTVSSCNPDICNKKWFWITTTINQKKQYPYTRDIYAITFHKDGNFSLDSDCNLISGTYKWDKESNKIAFDSFKIGKEICKNSQENQWIEQLKSIQKLSFDENQNLILENDQTKILLKIKQ